MNVLLEDIHADGFNTKSDLIGSTLTVRLIGNADMAVLDAMNKFMMDLHDVAIGNRVDDVVLDIRDLYFMNSYCLRELVAWVTRVVDATPIARYHVQFVANPNLPWQRRSLASIKLLAAGVVDVT